MSFGDFIKGVNSCERLSGKMQGFFCGMQEETREYPEGVSCGHLFWAIPANILINAATFIMAPIVTLVNLLAAAIFALFSCCSETARDYTKLLFAFGMHTLFDLPITAAIRVFNPLYSGANCALRGVAECYECLGIE